MNKVVKFLTICFLVYPSARLFGTYDHDCFGKPQIGGGYNQYGFAKPSNVQYDWPSMPSRETREPTPPKVLPASVISYGDPTQKQMAEQQRITKIKQDANERPLVKAAREGNLQIVQRICCSVPGRAVPEYNLFAFWAAIETAAAKAMASEGEEAQARYKVARYLAYEQPACNTYRRSHDGEELCYTLFWDSVMQGNRAAFDFFLAHGIDIHHISKRRWNLSFGEENTSKEEFCYRGVHVNAISFLRTGYFAVGTSEERRYIEWVLGQRGLTDAPPADYSSGGGGCCEVQ
jgi:hypothetical protein